jgi:hypothetical protein
LIVLIREYRESDRPWAEAFVSDSFGGPLQARRGELLDVLALPARAQAPWPDRTVRIIVPYPAGGSIDGASGAAAVAFAVGFSEAAFVGLLTRLGGSLGGG